jgi:hypothetical protein
VLREEVLFIPESVCPLKTYILSRRIPGVRLIRTVGDCRAKLGEIVQLQPGARLDCCGDGYSERTIKVHCAGEFYFVFLQDVTDPKSSAV